MSIRLINAAKKFGIGTRTIIDYLKDNGYVIENRPTAYLTQEMYDKLSEKFQSVKPDANRDKNEREGSTSSSFTSDDDKKVASVEIIKSELESNELVSTSELEITTVPEAFMSKLASVGHLIQNQRIHEFKNRVNAPAMSYIKAKYLNGIEHFWIVNPSERNLQYGYDITGHVNMGYRQPTQYNINNGRGVMKSTMVAEYLTKKPGIYTFNLRSKQVTLEIFHNTIYTPNPNNNEAIDLKVDGVGDQVFTFRTLAELLENTKKLKEKIGNDKALLESKKNVISEEEIAKIEHRLKNEENELVETVAQAKSFIRTQTKLRYQPILDEVQERIKRSMVFTGHTLIINGGPGTGKTTSLIHRIKFLLDPYALLDYASHLTDRQKEAIISSDRWVFYSPAALLKDFLKDNMVREGLTADDKHVMVWSKHQMTLFRDYQLSNPNGAPFSFYKDDKETLLPDEPSTLKDYIEFFEQFFLELITNTIYKVTEAKVLEYSWRDLALQIKANLSLRKKPDSMLELIRLIISLDQQFGSSVNDLSKQLSEAITKLIARCIAAVNYDSKVKEDLDKLLKSWEETELATVEDDNEIDENIDEEADIFEEADFNFERSLTRFTRPLLRKLSISLASGNKIKLSTKEEKLKELMDPIIDFQELPHFKLIGELAIFINNFGRITKGVEALLLSPIPNSYKLFRKHIISSDSKLNGLNYALLEKLVKEETPKNRKIHSNEIAFIITFINELFHQISQLNKPVFESLSHKYKTSFLTNSKHVIGVDEATDFHPIELKCMYSLRDTEVSSITLSGDLMQRMRKDGLKDWEDLKEIISKVKVENLIVSYRQSPTLLELASRLYQKATGKQPLYEAYMQKSNLEPKPLYFMSNENSEKLNWIADRVMEIFYAYGNMLPSIAVLVPSEREVDSVAAFLEENERISGMGIEVLACGGGRSLGESSALRVFSVSHIKGLEFESVFFHNMDELVHLDEFASNSILKHLYVGLSRSTFYLGITLSTFPKKIQMIKDQLNEGKWR